MQHIRQLAAVTTAFTMADMIDASESRKSPEFATTRWSVVHAAGQQPSRESREALTALCQSYWYPLYAFVRRRVSDAHEAQDLTQAFFAELLEKNFVASATPQRGRFRAYLLTALKHFLSKQWDHQKAAKRGGGQSPLSLDFQAGDSRISLEPATALTPEQEYDRQWAMTLLHHTLERLEAEYDQTDKKSLFQGLKGFIIGDHPGATYRDVAAELEISEGAAKMAAHRMRLRYRELLRQEILQTVSGPEDIDAEIQELFSVLSR